MRRKRPDWHDYFLSIALSVSERGTCLRRVYGAVIVKDNVIVSTGYNGGAKGGINCVDEGKCLRDEMNIPAGERYELCLAVHAEANAIINASASDMKGAYIYIAGTQSNLERPNCMPCLMCQRMIANAGIEKVIYYIRFGDIEILDKKDLQIFALGGV